MDAQDFLYRHGDKLLVGLVAVLAAWGIYSACTDEAIRPAGIKAEEIIARIDHIKTASMTQQPPTLKDAPDHLGDMRKRFANSYAAHPVVADLTVHPDAGIIDDGSGHGFYYIYELKPPIVSVADKVGLVEVTVAPAPSLAHDDDRISDKTDATWSREVGKAKVENKASVIGYLIERKKEGEGWRQVAQVTADNPVAEVKDVVAFQTYDFRATTVIQASGYEPKNDAESVLVSRGSFPMKPIPWDMIDPTKENWSKLLFEPSNVAGFKVAGANKLYVSDPSDVFQIQVGSDLKIALRKVNGALQATAVRPGDQAAATPDDPADAGDEAGTATFEIYKLDRGGKGGGDGEWVGPATFKHKVGDHVGGEFSIQPKGSPRKKKVDFTTTFLLDRIERGKERVLFWEIKPKARAGGGKDRDLELAPVPKNVNVVVLKDQTTKMELVLIELGTLQHPVRQDTLVYPDYGPGKYMELSEFENHPDSFKQPVLTPPKPIPHQPGQGPLEQLHKAGNEFAVTDTLYYEMPDGRLVYWDNVNHTLGAPLYKPGSEPKATPDKDAKTPDAGGDAAPEPAKDAAKDAAKDPAK